jgi:hypothetical protein
MFAQVVIIIPTATRGETQVGKGKVLHMSCGMWKLKQKPGAAEDVITFEINLNVFIRTYGKRNVSSFKSQSGTN